MTDFITMQNRIRRELARDGLTADIKDAIVTAIADYRSDRFYFNEQTASVNTTAGGAFLTMPAKFSEIDNINKIISGQKTPLKKNNFLDIERAPESTGQPTDYAIFKEGIWLYPVPNEDYALNFIGKVDLTEVSGSATSGATNAWMADAEAMIRSKAKEHLYTHRLFKFDRAEKMEKAAKWEWIRLQNRTGDKIATGRIKLQPF